MFAVPDHTVLISDGGLATELEARGHDLSDALWSARLLVDAPDEITAVHAAFFRAGAMFATTASYQASFDGFASRGVGRKDAARLLSRSVELAKAARALVGEVGASPRRESAANGRGRLPPAGAYPGSQPTCGGGRWVAASVGPYGAALADGSEYRGRYGLTVAQLARWHRPRLEVLADAGPDVLALETLPDIDEAEALVSLVTELGLPAWLSYTIEGKRTRAGQPLADAFALAAAVPEIVAVGVNCCDPADVLPAIELARSQTAKPLIVYPNSGERWDARARAWVGPSRFTAAVAPRWLAAGARIIGGCCRVRPADIAELAAQLAAAG